MSDGRYRLIGSTASPYAIKLRALLRYRRIPFDWVIMTKALRKQTEHLRPNLIPVLQYPDGTFRGETTTLAYDLETRHPERSVIPEDKAVAFVCDLLEDLADEWAVKPLFLYRWWDPEDQAYVSRWSDWTMRPASMASGIRAKGRSVVFAEALLRITGELYLPFLAANADAFAKGARSVGDRCLGSALCADAVQISGQMPRSVTRQICRTRPETSYSASPRAGAYRMLGAFEPALVRKRAYFRCRLPSAVVMPSGFLIRAINRSMRSLPQNNSPLNSMVGTPNTPSASASSMMRSCSWRAGPRT